MLNNPNAEALMQDARAMQARAEALLAAGDWRDAADKGWLAVRNATAALVLETTGVHNRTSTQINAGLRKLARERGGEYAELWQQNGDFAKHLHSRAFYDGVRDDDLPVFVRQVADYLRRAEELAGNDA